MPKAKAEEKKNKGPVAPQSSWLDLPLDNPSVAPATESNIVPGQFEAVPSYSLIQGQAPATSWDFVAPEEIQPVVVAPVPVAQEAPVPSYWNMLQNPFIGTQYAEPLSSPSPEPSKVPIEDVIETPGKPMQVTITDPNLFDTAAVDTAAAPSPMPLPIPAPIAQLPESELKKIVYEAPPEQTIRGLEVLKQAPGSDPDFLDYLKQQLVNAQEQGMPLSLQPVAALVDTWTGSNLAPYIRPPYTATEARNNIANLQDMVRKYSQYREQTKASRDAAQLADKFRRDQLAYQKRRNEILDKLADRKVAAEEKKANAAMMKAAKAGSEKGTSFTDKNLTDFRGNFMKAEPFKKADGYLSLIQMYDKMDRFIGKHRLSPTGPSKREFEALFYQTAPLWSQAVGSGAMQEADFQVYKGTIPNIADLETYVGQILLGGGAAGARTAAQTSIKFYDDLYKSNRKMLDIYAGRPGTIERAEVEPFLEQFDKRRREVSNIYSFSNEEEEYEFNKAERDRLGAKGKGEALPKPEGK